MSTEEKPEYDRGPKIEITWAEIAEELNRLRNLTIAATDSEVRRFAMDSIAVFHRAYLLPRIVEHHDHFSPHRFNR